MKLHAHQVDWLNAVIAEMKRGRRGVLAQAPTGFGKTVCLGAYAEKLARLRWRTLILVHRQEILLQTVKTIGLMCNRVGVIASREVVGLAHNDSMAARRMYIDNRAPILVASIQKLTSDLKAGRELPPASCVMVDEAHHAAAKTWGALIDHYAKHRDGGGMGARLLGVTATPERLDGRSLSTRAGGFFDGFVEGPGIRFLVENGFLSPPQVMVPRQFQINRNELDGDFVGGEFNMKKAAKAARKIVGSSVDEYAAKCPGEPAIAFCCSIQMCQEVAERFRAAGWKAAAVDGRMTESERQRIISGLGRGDPQVVCSCDLISEGMDVPAASAAFLLRPTTSRAMHLQQIGRVLRVAPGKSRAVIFDHVGNVGEHGHPLDPIDWSSIWSGGEEPDDSEGGVHAILCPDCKEVNEGWRKKCKRCGALLPRGENPRSEPEEVMGELVAETPSALAAAMVEAWEAVGSGAEGEALAERVMRIAERHSMPDGWAERFASNAGDFMSTPLWRGNGH